jgi:putative ABC transport system permease protein
MLRDLIFAFRGLFRNKLFAASAILTIGLGIGSSVVMFTVLSAVLLRPLPYSDPGRLVLIWETKQQLKADRVTVAAPNFEDWREQNHVFEGMTLVEGGFYHLARPAGTVNIRALLADGEFFRLLGMSAHVGRTLNMEDVRSNSDVLVLSDALWKKEFAGNPDVIGRTARLDNVTYTIVGVLPPDFYFPVAKHWDIVVPLRINPQEQGDRQAHTYGALARLRNHVSLAQAQAEMDTIARGLAERYPTSNAGSGVRLIPLKEEAVGNVRAILTAISGAVGLLLLIMCSNVAMLLLVRSAGRKNEIAIRTAIGASRKRLLMQLLIENLLLASLGGLLGLALAWSCVPLLRAMPVNLPGLSQASIDWRVLAFSLLAVIASVNLFGLAPALASVRKHGGPILQSLGRQSLVGGDKNTVRILHACVLLETTFAIVLLAGAGLLAGSLWKVLNVDPGFASQRVVAGDLSLALIPQPDPRYVISFYNSLLEHLRQFPEVASAGLTTNLPIGAPSWQMSFSIQGRPLLPDQVLDTAQRIVSAGYFQTMGIPLLAGRFFDDRDISDREPVAVVNNAFVRRYFPDRPPIGQRLKLGRPEDSGLPWFFTIVGVVGNVRYRDLETSSSPEMYMCMSQMVGSLQKMTPDSATLVVKSRHSAGLLPNMIHDEVEKMNSQVILTDVRTMDSVLSESMTPLRFNVELFFLFAGLALVLAWIGIYGVLTYATVMRMREIAIRMALGASPHSILRLVMGRAARLAAAGILLGLSVSWFATRLLRSVLYGISPHSTAVLMVVSLVVCSAAALASYLPARRAMAIDPNAILRSE